jgi:transposase
VGANPVDRGKRGSKLHLVCDGQGLPLAAAVTAAGVADVTMLQAMVDDIPLIRTPSGRRRTRPGAVHADKGYDSAANRAWLRRRRIRPRIARRWVESSARLGRQRWKVERALSWLSCFRRLQVRWDRGAGRWFAFVLVACALTCGNRLEVRPALQTYRRAAVRPVVLDAAGEGRSHSAIWVGCIVWSTTASSSLVNASRSTCWRSRTLNAAIVRAAS